MLLGDLDELPRLDQAPLGVPPSDQRLNPGQPARVEAHDRLVSQLELVELDRLLELHRELVALVDGLVHSRIEHGEARLAARLRHVHGDVGVANHVHRTIDRVARAGDPDARGDRDRVVGDQVRRPQLADEPVGHGP